MHSGISAITLSTTPEYHLNITCADLQRFAGHIDPAITFLEALRALYRTGLASPLPLSSLPFTAAFAARLRRACWAADMSVNHPRRRSGPLLRLDRLPREGRERLEVMARQSLLFLPCTVTVQFYWRLLNLLVARGCRDIGLAPCPQALMIWLKGEAERAETALPPHYEPFAFGLPLVILPSVS